MSTEREALSEAEIERIVDARLAAHERAPAAARLAEDSETAAVVEAHRDLNARLRARFDPVLEEPIPGVLIRSATRGPRARSRPPRRRFALAAALAGALLAAGATGGWLWWAHGVTPAYQRVFAKQAAYAHRLYARDPSRPVELGAERSGELVAWLSRRLAMPVVAPALDAAGLRLVGGRLLPAADAAAGQLIYEQRDGRHVSLYLRGDIPARDEVEFRFASEGDVSVLYWIDGPRGYAIAGTLDRDRLLAIARLVYDQFRS